MCDFGKKVAEAMSEYVHALNNAPEHWKLEGQRIRAAREDAGFGLREAAKLLKLETSELGYMEQGLIEPGATIAAFFECYPVILLRRLRAAIKETRNLHSDLVRVQNYEAAASARNAMESLRESVAALVNT